MGIVKRKMEKIDLFSTHFCEGEIRADYLRLFCVFAENMLGEVRGYGVRVFHFDGFFWAAIGEYERPELTDLVLIGIPEGETAESREHNACIEALFCVPGVIVEID